MTDVGSKNITSRLATATCTVLFSNSRVYQLLTTQSIPKGDVFSVARIAGIMGAKKTADIVPLCHPGIGISGVEVDVTVREPEPDKVKAKATGAGEGRDGDFVFGGIDVKATVRCVGKTGVEMEAMTAVMSAALTVYDMCKAVDKGMVVTDAKVVEKLGGKSGHWVDGKKVE